MKKKRKYSAVDRREAILGAHEIHEESRTDDEKFWSGLWHATIPREFLVVAIHEKFNGSTWSVYAYIVMRMDLESGKSRKLRNDEICEALGISESTLDRAKATLKEYGFLTEDAGDGSIYYAQDIEAATEKAKLRRIRKRKEAQRDEDEEAIAEEERRIGRSLAMRERQELIKTKFDRSYNPNLA